jgi:chromosome segregation ATPase
VQAVRQVYDGLRADALAELEQATQVHNDALQAAQTDLAQLRTQITALAGEKSALAADLARTQDEVARLRAELQSHSVLQAAAQSENTGLVQRLADRAAEVATVNHQLTHARSQFEHYQESNAMQRAEERQSFERRIAEQDHELGRLRQHLELKQVAAAQHAGQMARVIEENARLERDAHNAQVELGQLRADRERATSDAAQATTARTLMLAKQETLLRELGDAHIALAVRAREAALAGERLTDMERRTDALAQEKLDQLRRQATLEAELRLCRAAVERPAG